MTVGRLVLASLCVLLSFVSAGSRARADAETQGELIARAESFERENQPREALAAWQRALELQRSSRLARRCEARIAYLSARSEGDFQPLARLMTMQHGGIDAQSESAIRAFERDVARMPAGIVRRESRALIAEAWSTSIRAPAQAVEAYLVWLREGGLTPNERRSAMSGLASAYAANGETRRAAQALDAAGISRTPAAEMIRREAKRRVGRVVATGVVLLFVLIAIAAVARSGLSRAMLRSVLSPLAILAAGFACAVPLAIANWYDHAASDTFAVLGGVGLVALLLARLTGSAFDARPTPTYLRAGAAVSAGLAFLSVGYLLLDRAGGLLSIGL